MTSFQPPIPPGQDNQEPTDQKKLLRHYAPPAAPNPQADQQTANSPSGPGNTQPPAYLAQQPMGQVPTTFVMDQNRQQYGKQPGNPQAARAAAPNPPSSSGLLGGSASRAIAPNPPSSSGLLGGSASRAAAPNPPSSSGLLGGSPAMTQTRPPQGQPQAQQNMGTQQQRPDVVNGNLILHRSEHFYLRTAYRPGQQNPLHKPKMRTKPVTRAMPEQEKRIAQSETRLLPSVAPINPLKKERFPIPAWLEAVVVFIGLVLAFAAHAINMFNFPRYELDEGTYMSSAWSILHGQITPYAYGYGHPPLAWIQIAAWIQFTGGFFTFGNALNSGRVFMVVLATIDALLVYQITRRLGGTRAVGLLALVIFALSPLSVTYQREVLLDNVATFWLLLSLYLLAVGNSHMLYLVFSALCLGMAFLSKEVFVLFIPAMLYAVWLHTTKFQRKFAMVAFIYTVIATCSAFVLMAILKGELFPYTWHLPWDTHDHLSMIQTFLDQGKRGAKEGSFLTGWNNWMSADGYFVIDGIAALTFNLITGWWYRKNLLLALLTASFWLLLIRGGVVLPFYIIPIIPLAAMNIALAIDTLLGWLAKLVHFDFVRVILILAAIGVLVPYDIHTEGPRFTLHPTSVQTDAMVWVRNNVPRNNFIIINSYLYTDLHVPGGQGVGDGTVYPYAHVYVNVATDPELYGKILQNNWDRIDYIVADSEVLSYIQGLSPTGNDPGHILRQALDHSIMRVQFTTQDQSGPFSIEIYEVQHTLAPPMVMVPSKVHTLATNSVINRRFSVD